jgi:cardiolipin synthase
MPGPPDEPEVAAPAAGAALPADRPLLAAGARGDAVLALQQALSAWRAGRGEPALGADGAFGPATLAAVQAFQVASGLAADGRVGPKTWDALAAAAPAPGGAPATGGPRPVVVRPTPPDAPPPVGPAATGAWAGFDAYLDGLPATPKAFDGNRVKLLVDGPAAFAEMRDAIGAAESSIDFETFDFSGRAASDMADLLIQKAREGLKVRAIIDETGLEDPQGKAAVERLQAFAKTGDRLAVSIQPSHEVAGLGGVAADGPGTVAMHDHRKGLVLDHKTAFIGGMNVTDDERTGAWHDMEARLDGPAAIQQRYYFMNHWRELNPGDDTPELEAADWVTPAGDPGDNVRIVAHTPGADENIRLMYLKAIETAQTSIKIEVPYFDDPRIMNALMAAARRGVKVQCVWPARSDQISAQEAGRSWYPKLIAAGAEVYEYRDRMAHEKVASFDGKVATIGSSNLDPLSLSGLYEQNLVAIDRDGRPGFAHTLEAAIDADIAQRSTRIAKIMYAPGEEAVDWNAPPTGRTIAIDTEGRIVDDGGPPPAHGLVEVDGTHIPTLDGLIEPHA